MTVIPKNTPGLAESQSDAFSNVDLLLSDVPQYMTDNAVCAASMTFAIYEVVALVGGELVPADIADADPANHDLAYAITATAVTTGVGETPTIPIITGGHFNIDALTWPASYDTDAKKLAAFQGMASPGQIKLGVVPNNRT